ncbi:MAG: alpha/beta hydrolase [Candidatus Pacebacteria bacterium]|nr:alpha/beta hydrolase [Candidatus Paceibacterota bacterium]
MDTLIILHGWQSSREKWQKTKELLETQSLKVVVPDLPGFKPENQLDKPWNLDNYVEWLNNFLENSNSFPEPFFLLGHSFGGRIAIKFAVKYPEKLKGLILVSSAGIKKEKTFRDKVLLKAVKFAKKLGVQEQASQTKGLWQIIRKVFYRYILRQTDYFKANSVQKEIMKNALEEDLKPLLNSITASTLIVWGKKDKMTLLKDAYLMKEKIKNSYLEIIDNIGHTPHLECPEILAQKIKNFIQP